MSFQRQFLAPNTAYKTRNRRAIHPDARSPRCAQQSADKRLYGATYRDTASKMFTKQKEVRTMSSTDSLLAQKSYLTSES